MRLSDKIARDSEVIYLKTIIARMLCRMKVQTLQDSILRQEALAAAATGRLK